MEESEAMKMRRARDDLFTLLIQDGENFHEAVLLTEHYFPEVF